MLITEISRMAKPTAWPDLRLLLRPVAEKYDHQGPDRRRNRMAEQPLQGWNSRGTDDLSGPGQVRNPDPQGDRLPAQVAPDHVNRYSAIWRSILNLK